MASKRKNSRLALTPTQLKAAQLRFALGIGFCPIHALEGINKMLLRMQPGECKAKVTVELCPWRHIWEQDWRRHYRWWQPNIADPVARSAAIDQLLKSIPAVRDKLYCAQRPSSSVVQLASLDCTGYKSVTVE